MQHNVVKPTEQPVTLCTNPLLALIFPRQVVILGQISPDRHPLTYSADPEGFLKRVTKAAWSLWAQRNCFDLFVFFATPHSWLFPSFQSTLSDDTGNVGRVLWTTGTAPHLCFCGTPLCCHTSQMRIYNITDTTTSTTSVWDPNSFSLCQGCMHNHPLHQPARLACCNLNIPKIRRKKKKICLLLAPSCLSALIPKTDATHLPQAGDKGCEVASGQS